MALLIRIRNRFGMPYRENATPGTQATQPLTVEQLVKNIIASDADDWLADWNDASFLKKHPSKKQEGIGVSLYSNGSLYAVHYQQKVDQPNTTWDSAGDKESEKIQLTWRQKRRMVRFHHVLAARRGSSKERKTLSSLLGVFSGR